MDWNLLMGDDNDWRLDDVDRGGLLTIGRLNLNCLQVRRRNMHAHRLAHVLARDRIQGRRRLREGGRNMRVHDSHSGSRRRHRLNVAIITIIVVAVIIIIIAILSTHLAAISAVYLVAALDIALYVLLILRWWGIVRRRWLTELRRRRVYSHCLETACVECLLHDWLLLLLLLRAGS